MRQLLGAAWTGRWADENNHGSRSWMPQMVKTYLGDDSINLNSYAGAINDFAVAF